MGNSSIISEIPRQAWSADGGPHPFGEAFKPRRITKVGELSKPVYRSFIASFGVAIIAPEAIANDSNGFRSFLLWRRKLVEMRKAANAGWTVVAAFG